MKLVARLIKLLEQNADLYEQVAEKTRMEKDIIEKGSLDELNEIVKEKERLALKIRKVDHSRLLLMEEIGASLGISPSEITLEGLAVIPKYSNSGAKLLELRDRLKNAVKTAKELGDFNRVVLDRAMGTIKDSFMYASGLIDSKSDTYSRGMTVDSRISSGKMVTRSY